MSEKTLIQLLTEQVELSKQILEELKKQNAPITMPDSSNFDMFDSNAAEHLLSDKVVEQEETQLDKMMRECYGLYKSGTVYDGYQDYFDATKDLGITIDLSDMRICASQNLTVKSDDFDQNCIKYGLKGGSDTNVPKMRPIEDWLNELPEPIRSNALDSVNKESQMYLSCRGISATLYSALICSNDAYCLTKQGTGYWDNIHNQLKAGTPPGELVDPVHLDKSKQ